MGWLEDKIQKWTRLIEEHTGQGISEKVLAGEGILAQATPEQRAEWSLQAMERFRELVPDLKVRERIMVERSCVFTEEFGEEPLLKLRQIYADTGSIEAVIDEMCADTYKYARPYVENNVIYETKNPRFPEEFEKAATPEEKRKAYCHCPLAGKGEVPMDPTYCFCGGGWYKGIWEFILEREVQIKLLKSVMKGDERCTFAVILSPNTS
ncbi:hypothetical protein JXM67_15505 [candidate division WOR-3 bacterium]|nr:hypothetical protein [candidate division WOR-3 bacterium]